VLRIRLHREHVYITYHNDAGTYTPP